MVLGARGSICTLALPTMPPGDWTDAMPPDVLASIRLLDAVGMEESLGAAAGCGLNNADDDDGSCFTAPPPDIGDWSDVGAASAFCSGSPSALRRWFRVGSVGTPPAAVRRSSPSPISSGSGICTAPNGPPRSMSAWMRSCSDSTPRARLASVADVMGPPPPPPPDRPPDDETDGDTAGRSDDRSPPDSDAVGPAAGLATPTSHISDLTRTSLLDFFFLRDGGAAAVVGGVDDSACVDGDDDVIGSW